MVNINVCTDSELLEVKVPLIILGTQGWTLDSFTSPFRGNTNPTRDALPSTALGLHSIDQPLTRLLHPVQTVALNFRFVDSLIASLEAMPDEGDNIARLLGSLHKVRILELACSNTGNANSFWDQFGWGILEAQKPGSSPLAELEEFTVVYR
ncbi:uncharacterized protein BDZ99DRAFT_516086 [Mytilinidion resinicola]|uniref:Uncharacterized protein n=1 Tax=Mytilinidion resinicola TaxID=574789 RepID=A0A6A6Z3X8_9PEZI|nr:uncharacterized protein BDZ99DRAFT_516086 [Mytilinidion resinicola]KAF2815353.1 hypothetical protein BDZ99DRAFT_516086 [Mytilinidion resinicola]